MDQALVPTATDILCESCGYTLNGLPETGNCPECGTPITDSTTASPRTLPAWETGQDRPIARFQQTALAILRAPTTFFRTLSIHGDINRSRQFARIALVPTIVFSTKAVVMHQLMTMMLGGQRTIAETMVILIGVPIAVTLSWLAIYWAVARLTALEARYWGYRLHLDVVRRALHYLTIQAMAATLLPLIVVWVYLCLLIADNERFGAHMAEYLYAFSASVILSAVYLFRVYWIGMRSLLYANR